MRIEKEELVELLRARGEHDKAVNVQCRLPRQVDTEADAGVLHQLDVKIHEVTEGLDRD